MYARRPVPASIRARPRGLGQDQESYPSCSIVDFQAFASTATFLLGIGATGVGAIGIFASKEHKEAFALTAGLGAVATVIGGLWFYTQLQNIFQPCMGAQGILEPGFSFAPAVVPAQEVSAIPALPASSGT